MKSRADALPNCCGTPSSNIVAAAGVTFTAAPVIPTCRSVVSRNKPCSARALSDRRGRVDVGVHPAAPLTLWTRLWSGQLDPADAHHECR